MVLLDEVAAALGQWRAGARLRRIIAVKFRRAVLPDEKFEISLEAVSGDEIQFGCAVAGDRVVEGRCEIAT